MAVSLELLTDDDILDYSRSDGKDHVLFSHGDLNLKYDRLQPITGGVYDIEIFGSPMVDRCICGKIHQASPDPQQCPNCGARVYTKEAALRRFARIELGFYYLQGLRYDIFKQKFDSIFQDCKITLDFSGDNLSRLGYSSRGAKKIGIKVFDSCQFEYKPETKELIISEAITDESKCSYEGLMKIIEEHFPEHLTEYRKLINRYYLVMPAVMRPFTLAYKDGKKLMGTHVLSTLYSSIIWLCCPEDKKSMDGLNYETVMSKLKTPGERVRYTALLRAYLNSTIKEATELLNTSKENLARELYSVRVKNSARCPIVPDMNLKIDELGVPRSIAYEMLREDFIKYLMEKLNFSEKEARKATKEEALNEETQKLFTEYAETRMVLVNRQPSLHEYSIFCMKIKLVDDYTIHFPPAICTPLNADFDGDTVAIQTVPVEAAEDTYRKMSPRFVKVYKKDRSPIPQINHETLNGLAVATEWTPEDPSELKEPKYFYDNYAKLLKDVEIDHKIKIGTPIVFTYDFGNGLKYQSEVTTYGKIRISKILGKNIDDYDLTKDKYTRFNAKSASKLSLLLCDDEDEGIEKRLELQKFCLRVVSLAGVATFDFKTLYADSTDSETYKELCKIADSPDLTDQQKLCLLTEKYDEYEKEIEGKFSDDLKDELNRAGRIKISSITSLNTSQLIISGVDEKPIITRGSLLTGLSEKDMIYHSIENRSLQSIKVSGVNKQNPNIYVWCASKIQKIAGRNKNFNQQLIIV